MKRVYLDNNATTPLDSEVKQSIVEALDIYGNPSSHHLIGRIAKKRMDEARENIAKMLNASPDEIIFTSGASESNNIVIHSILCGYECDITTPKNRRRRFITTSIEHPSVIETAHALACEGVETIFLPVNIQGNVDMTEFKEECEIGASLVSIMTANNEVGVIQPIKEMAKIAHDNGLLFHTDAVQAAGKIDIDVKASDVDFLSISGHKMYAPKGIGALYIKKGRKICPLILGGHQETGLRAGTENMIGIIALGKAAEIAVRDGAEEAARIQKMRDRLEAGLLQKIPGAHINGDRKNRVPNTLNISFEKIEGESILYMLDHVGIEVSTGSACSSGSLNPSHVLTAMGIDIGLTHSSIRISLGKNNTEEEIDYVLEQFPPIIAKLREISPFA